MPIENNPTPRADDPTQPNKRGIIAARKYIVPAAGGTLTIPAKVKAFFFKNSHATNSFGFNFDSDVPADFYTLIPGESTPLMSITESTVIKAKGIGGDSEAEAVFMG